MNKKETCTRFSVVVLAFLLTVLGVLNSDNACAQQASGKGKSEGISKDQRKQRITPLPDIDLHVLEGLDYGLAQLPFEMDQASMALDQLEFEMAGPRLEMTSDVFSTPMASLAQELAAEADIAGTTGMTYAPAALAQMQAELSLSDAELAVVRTSMLAEGDLVPSQDTPNPQESAAQKAYQKAYNLVLDKKWTDAQKELDGFVNKYPNSSFTIAARYWKCYSSEKLGDPAEEVFKKYQKFLDKYSDSKWADDARTSMIRVGSELAKQGKTEYSAIVQSMQQGDDEDVKLTALYALQNSPGENTLPIIMDLYDKSKSEKLRGKIVYVLGSFDSPLVVPKLADIAVKDPNMMVRKNAVYALGNTKKSEAAAALKQIVKSQTDADIRTTALYSLANLDDADLIPFLVEIARSDGNEKLAKTATYSIANINDVEATKALQTILKQATYKEARKAALNALGNRPDADAVAILKEVAMGKDNDSDMRRTATYALGNIHTSSSLEALKSIVASDAESRIKEAAIQALGNRGGSEVRDILKKIALTDEDNQLARTAVYALGNSREDKDTSFYFDVIRNGKSLEVRKAALYQLANVIGSGAVKTLGQVIKDEKDDDLKISAIYVLGNLRSDDAVGLLLTIAQKDGNKRARTAAVSALSNIGTKKAQEALVQILEGQSKEQ